MKKVLIVDDSELIVTLLRTLFEDEGYDVEVAYDGDEGLKKAGEVSPDLILLDMLLPRMRGDEVCRHLKQGEVTKIIPVIVFTTVDNRDLAEKMLRIGAVDYFVKPFDMSSLIHRVEEVLSNGSQGS
ncbi:MAG: response regulator [Candidatus Omnitrophica bacterium]|nr:response regulator [Candidatus Omnitrophota bacterium]